MNPTRIEMTYYLGGLITKMKSDGKTTWRILDRGDEK